jgi:hypothetical protein
MVLTIHKSFVYIALSLCLALFILLLNRPAESAARRYQYRVVAVTGMTELRTQANSGQLKTIEKMIEDQAAQGWEFYQADGYVLYFRK